MAEHKKYWIKLEKDFLNSSQIKVIKNLPNGKDYVIFYLALMLESTSTEGHLRFSELVPYNETMLASITDTNVDIVRSAMKVFQDLGMIQVLENGTLFLPEVPRRIGKEGESAERVRLFREKQKLLQCNGNETNCNDNKDKDIDKEEDKDKQKHKYGKYKHVLLTDEQYKSLKETFPFDYEEKITNMDESIELHGYKYKNHYLAILKWARKDNSTKENEKMTDLERARRRLLDE